MHRRLLALLFFSAVFPALSTSALANSDEKTQAPAYIESLGGLKSKLNSSSPSEVLRSYVAQLPYAVDNPHQDFLHNMNLGGLALMANRPREARNYFLKAARHIHWQNYTSILEEVGKVIIAEDTWERRPLLPQEFLIYHYLFSLTYLQEQNWKSALVSIRAMEKVLQDIEKIYLQNPLKEHAFFYWYSGFIYEKNKLYDDARIDYELTYKVAPDWPGVESDIWRASALAQDDEREKSYAKKIQLDNHPKAERLRIAQNAKSQFAFIHIYQQNRRLSPNQLTMLAQASRIQNMKQPETHMSFSRLSLDRELEKKTQGTLPNPAYLIHINPISAVLLSIKEIVKGFFSDSDLFKVNSVAFIPEAIFIIPVNDSMMENSNKNVIANLGFIHLMQSLDGYYLIPLN